MYSNAQTSSTQVISALPSRRFLRVFEGELTALRELTKSEILVFCALRFLTCGWDDPPRLRAHQIADRAGVGVRAAQIALARLIDRGLVTREGAAQDPAGCVYQIIDPHEFDRSSSDQDDRSKADRAFIGSRSRSSLPTLPRAAPDKPSTDGRKVVDLISAETVRAVSDVFGPNWSDGIYVRRCLQRLAGATELPTLPDLLRFVRRELDKTRAYRADYPPGVVLRPERLEAWQKKRAEREETRRREAEQQDGEPAPMAVVRCRQADVVDAGSCERNSRGAKALLAAIGATGNGGKTS
jgi:hypothetical protein